MSKRKDIFWRAYLIYFGFVVLMLVAFIKTITIQFDHTSSNRQTFMTSNGDNEKMPTRTVKRTPRRGQILDANYTPLVTSVSYYDIHMDPTVVNQELFDNEIGALCAELAKMYPSKSKGDYERFIRAGRNNNRRYLLIKEKATNMERKKIREMPIFREGRLKGGIIDNEQTIERDLPYDQLLKRTLGYVEWDDIKKKWRKVGIEGAFNEYLKGVEGEEIEQKISTGWKKIGPITKEAVEGASVVTTIDIEIQEVAHAELLRQLQNQEAKNGCAIVMDVKTGYVKAIVNLKRGNDGNYYESFNQAIGTCEVPGSTFKLATLMALLEDNKVSLTDKVNASGVYRFYDLKLEDSNHGYGYGEITIQQAFEKSSNVFSKIVNDSYKSNPKQFTDRIKSFGLADSLGIELAGEGLPVMHEPGTSNWYGTTLPWMAIGYEYLQTPLQTLTFYNAVANNGVMVKPQFVQEIIREETTIKTCPPIVVNDQICSNGTLKDLQTCLKGVVKRGTGQALQSAYFDIAGKTGTAQVLNDDLRYGEEGERKYQASFAGYFPADDPIYSCIVVVSGPTKEIYGAKVSGTVFTAIANKVYASSLQYHTPINEGELSTENIPVSKDGNRYDLLTSYRALNIPFNSTTDGQWVNTSKKGTKVSVTKRNISKDQVPDVKGMTAKDAVYLIERTGMSARIEGFGRVTKQSIRPGTPVQNGVVIKLTLE